MTLPTKVPSDSLGRMGRLKRTSDKSLFPMALGSCGHRITHQLRPINMNGRSILSVTSKMESGTPGSGKQRIPDQSIAFASTGAKMKQVIQVLQHLSGFPWPKVVGLGRIR